MALPMNKNIKLDFSSVMNAQSFSFGRNISKIAKMEKSLYKNDSVDSIVDEDRNTTDEFYHHGSLSPNDENDSTLIALKSQLHS